MIKILINKIKVKKTEQKLHYYPFLIQLFGQMSHEELDLILDISELLILETGQYVFHQGDTDNSLYVVLSGRLRAIQEIGEKTTTLGDISAGEPVGELALFTREQRSASVVALRKSAVLQLNEVDYLLLVKQFPKLGHMLTQFIIDRLKRNAFYHKDEAKPKNIALVNLQPDFDINTWTEDIGFHANNLGLPLRIYDHFSQRNTQENSIFDEIEQEEGLNFLVCSDKHIEWATQCITYCDMIVLAVPFDAPKGIYEIEKLLKLHQNNILNKKVYLLLLHQENAALPSGTRFWFENRKIDLHFHVRKNNHLDLRRFCRIISHQAIGLVFGGGGTKGYAHVGAAKAMIEAGIEFDFVGGTSAGALFGLGMAHFDFDYEKIEYLCEEGKRKNLTSNDYTLPFISLMSGQKVKSYLENTLGNSHLDDFWINSYCVSTNYSTAELKIHKNGLASKCIAASIAIPGIFPPVAIDNHLFIDGGVLDNLPIEAMFQKPVKHIIAIALSVQTTDLVEDENLPTAKQMFWDKILKKKRYNLPSLPSILVNAMMINSRQKQENKKLQVSLYMEFDLNEHGLLEWQFWRELMEKGYNQCKEILQKLPEKEKFW